MKPDPRRYAPGGVIHTYQKYDPQRFPSPTQPPPDLVSPAFEQWLISGSRRRLTAEELARAIRLDPSQIRGLGPSLESLMAMLLERKRKILATYETDSVLSQVARNFVDARRHVHPPQSLRKSFERAVATGQLYLLERLWYAVGDDQSPFARQLLPLMERLGEKFEIEELAARYAFTGSAPLTVPQALAIKEELEQIDKLLQQLQQARETAQIGLIDLEALAEFAEPGDLDGLQALQQAVQDYLRELAAQQGLDHERGAFRLTPKAYHLFQSRLLERIFSQLQASRTGRHTGAVQGEGDVELPRTKPYEFGDSLGSMDIPQTLLNAMLRDGSRLPLRLKAEDIEVHRTRHNPKCATVVLMDMSGSMRYEGQYVDVKRMALALDGLIRREYPGDDLKFIEVYTFARLRHASEIIDLMPKPVTIYDPVVRLRADMSRPETSESMIHPHFTNLQHGLQLARRLLAAQDTPNRQIILITDGLPTAHFEAQWLYMLYPPDPRTEAVTLREGQQCQREGITINLFLIPSWSQTEADIRFAHQLAESTRGRVFFTAGRDLDRYVVWDYVQRKREVLG